MRFTGRPFFPPVSAFRRELRFMSDLGFPILTADFDVISRFAAITGTRDQRNLHSQPVIHQWLMAILSADATVSL
jgi:hypothetical protein